MWRLVRITGRFMQINWVDTQILQFICPLSRCTHRASSYNTYTNQQDTQNSCDQTLFSIRCSKCFGLYQSIIKSNFISCTSHLIYAGICRYVQLLCGYSHTTARRMVPAYTKCDVQLIEVAPDDGIIYSETCGASNRK